MNRDFQRLIQNTTAAFWSDFVKTNFKPGQTITIRSHTVMSQEPFNETLKFEYATDWHVHGKTETGVSVGIPIVYAIDIFEGSDSNA